MNARTTAANTIYHTTAIPLMEQYAKKAPSVSTSETIIASIDEYAIKYMVGHKISDITEKVYTQREFDWLKEEIEKIK